MRRLIAAGVLAGSLAFGAAWWGASLPLRIALLWAAGSSIAAPAIFVVTRRIVCEDGRVIEIDDNQGKRGKIRFVDRTGRPWGPYDRT